MENPNPETISRRIKAQIAHHSAMLTYYQSMLTRFDVRYSLDPTEKTCREFLAEMTDA